jgi:predicted O-methyltransferase YrrM
MSSSPVANRPSLARRVYRRARREFQQYGKWLERKWRQRAIREEYGTHLPLLQALCSIHRPRLAIEFGMGLNSTGFLLRQAEMLISVEHDPTWYGRVVRRLPHSDCVLAPVLWRDAQVEQILSLLADQRFDLALVDGPGPSRVPCAQALLSRAGFVVVHDTEAACYLWEPLFNGRCPAGVHFFTQREAVPWTTVFSSDLAGLRTVVGYLQGNHDDIDRVFPPVR